MFKNLYEGLLQLVFPSRCPSCQNYTEKPGQWCPQCFEELVRMENLAYNEDVRQYISPIFAMAKYKQGLQSLIHELKYQGKLHCTPYFLPFFNLLDDEAEFSDFDFIIPVPLHRDRLKARGYNQVDIIFQTWCEKHYYPYRDLLIRTRNTKKQHLLNYQARQDNLHTAFELKEPVSLNQAKCLIVDDIFTTGSTLKHCAQVLLANGASSVSGLVLASNANE